MSGSESYFLFIKSFEHYTSTWCFDGGTIWILCIWNLDF